ncbi:hypothetical protein BRC68_02740 [Halobacteriales archaeon QH_6_64_20]|nr:MAG: hypothetical protein BRC68_02740 [Halobacteriales archaeon QH_6_64_20]
MAAVLAVLRRVADRTASERDDRGRWTHLDTGFGEEKALRSVLARPFDPYWPGSARWPVDPLARRPVGPSPRRHSTRATLAGFRRKRRTSNGEPGNE